jgi:hypothetical protein
LSVEAFDLIHAEKVSPPCSDLIDQVGKTLLQSFDRRIFVVSPPWSFEESKQQNSGASLLADPKPDGSQYNSEGCLAFSLAVSVIDMELTKASLAAICSGDDSDAAVAASTVGL